MEAQHTGHRAFLDVPFTEKDEAKALGARWDPEVRRWYAPPRASPELQRWAAQPEMPEQLPGEDRSFGNGLFVDLVPASCWFTNVRSCIAQKDWERLRRMMLTRAGNRCEICGREEDRDRRRWLEAHERWHYNEGTGVQTLRRLILCCSWCHRTTHIGLAEVQGHGDEARAHLRAVTGMTDAQAQDHIDTAFGVWRTRSEQVWDLDLRVLTGVGISLATPPDQQQRLAVADKRLSEHRDGDQGISENGRTPAEILAAVEQAAVASRASNPETPQVEVGEAPPLRTTPWWKRRRETTD